VSSRLNNDESMIVSRFIGQPQKMNDHRISEAMRLLKDETCRLAMPSRDDLT